MTEKVCKDEFQHFIKCWGEDIERNGEKSKKYLSCIVRRESFDYIKKYINDHEIDYSKFDYVEVTYDQINKKIIFDFNTFSELGEENIIELNRDLNMFQI